MPEMHPFGRWPSTLDAAAAATAKLSVAGLRTLSTARYWVEGRPELGGRRVVLSQEPPGDPTVISPEGLSLASRVHEYGGGEMAVAEHDGVLVIGVRAADQALVAFRPGDAAVRVLLPGEPGDARGDLSVSGSLVLFVTEAHADGAVRRSVGSLDLATGEVIELLAGRDFYCHARLSDDGRRLVWCCWDHPDMSWEAAEVWISDLEGGSVAEPRRLAGGEGSAASHPIVLADGAVVLLEEVEGFVRPVRYGVDGTRQVLGEPGREHGGPIWVLGEEHLVEVDGRIVALQSDAGRAALVVVGPGSSVALEVPAMSLTTLAAGEGSVLWLGSTATALGAIGEVGLNSSHRSLLELGPPSPLGLDEIAVAEPIEAQGRAGDVVHGLLFRPSSRSASAPPGTLPPVIVVCHGGPTGQARAGFDPMIQLFCSRGFAVVAANYAGSTGFGAAYRHRLDAAWGIADVADCVDLVAWLGARGIVDASRAAIRGSSAGGLTALLGATTGAFVGVVSWYGVADLGTLVATTHDFEAHYLDRLVGPLPECEDRYVERSPVTRVGEMTGSVLLLQGLDDPVVPPAQSEAMAEALRAGGHDVELRCYEGEAHGFRRLETLVDAFEAELAFYQHHLCGPRG